MLRAKIAYYLLNWRGFPWNWRCVQRWASRR